MCKNGFIVLFVFITLFNIYFQTKCLGYHILDQFHSNSSSQSLRIRRQSSCRSTEFRCNNGQCIRTYSVCDGKTDCSDGSDEVLNCNPNGCRPDTFQCAYSACVDGDARCNGVNDCRDGSDEVGCADKPTNENKCGTKFACNDGQCINRYQVCDGIKHCSDGSDETFKECSSITCQTYAFRCAYGACVDGEAKCNGEQDCADGSDEPPTCLNTSTPSTVTPTPIPTGSSTDCPPININNGNYQVFGAGYIPGTPIPNYSLVSFSCAKGFALFPPSSIVNCVNGSWTSELPKCLSTCPPRYSDSVHVTCALNDFPLDCTKPLVEGTIATMKCKHHYVQAVEVIPTSECQGGSWDIPLLNCIPECGELTPDGVTNIIEGFSVKKGEFPWHIGLYRLAKDKYAYQCGGSIISQLVILSAAHCFTNELGTIRYPANEYYVAAGKYYSDYDSEEDAFAQKRPVKEYHIPPGYRGYETSFEADLAVIIVQKAFTLTNLVLPVCIDWDSRFEDQQLKPNNRGSVVGWGFTDPATMSPSVELKQLNAPYIDRGQCLDVVPKNFIKWVTLDKYCAGYTNGSSVCKGDSGGGMVFEWAAGFKPKYYLRGLVSVGPIRKGICDNFQYGVYTKVSFYISFIKRLEATNRVRGNF